MALMILSQNQYFLECQTLLFHSLHEGYRFALKQRSKNAGVFSPCLHRTFSGFLEALMRAVNLIPKVIQV